MVRCGMVGRFLGTSSGKKSLGTFIDESLDSAMLAGRHGRGKALDASQQHRRCCILFSLRQGLSYPLLVS